MKKERNYTIEFYRIMFAVNFLAVHVYMVFSRSIAGEFMYIYALDNILPFMIFAGYFMMQGFKRQQAQALAQGIPPRQQAGAHLKSRIMGLLPAFLVAQLGGFVVNYIFVRKMPLALWPMLLLNHICEFAGLQITGIGFGNGFTGAWGSAPPTVQLVNTPLWFISGIFVVGYLVYYLLAKCEDLYLGIIGPLFGLIFYASQYMLNSNPNWFNVRHLGDFKFAEGFPHMFVGLTLGCLMWVAVNKLKDKEWSRGMRVFMTIVSFLLAFIIIYKTWVPVNIPVWGRLVFINWGSVHVLSVFFTFFALLGADGFTRLLNRKIWAVPGRLAFYIYMFHYPIIVVIGNLMGVKDAAGLTPLYIVATVVTVVFGFLFMLLNDKVLQPWFKKMPWYSEKQRELELASNA